MLGHLRRAVSTPLTEAARVAELADKELRVGALGLGDFVEDGDDLVDCLVGVAADLELDERRVPVLRDLIAALPGGERRPDMLNSLQLGDAADDVLDRGGERWIARAK